MITSGIALFTSKLVHSQSQCSIRLLSTSLASSSLSDSCNLIVKDAGSRVVNGNYIAKDPKVLPKGFVKTCDDMGWNPESMWLQLSNQVSPWWKHTDNESYIYYNKGDGQWWIDDPTGRGLYVAKISKGVITLTNMDAARPPVTGWVLLGGGREPTPSVEMIPPPPVSD